MARPTVRVEQEGPRALVRIDRPEVLNALNAATLAELRRVAEEIADDESVRVVVITGAEADGKTPAFVGGADVAEMASMDASAADRFLRLGCHVMSRIEGMAKPVIAAVNGYALGGGCELALACDILLAAETARLGLLEINFAIIPGWGGTQRLPARVGIGKAKELIFSGQMVEASEAHRIGLVDRVYPPDRLLPEALAFADLLASRSPTALRLAKSAIQGSLASVHPTGFVLEAHAASIAFAREERKAAMKAFLDRDREH